MPTGKEVADKWFDQFGSGMQQSRGELAQLIDDAIAEQTFWLRICAGVFFVVAVATFIVR